MKEDRSRELIAKYNAGELSAAEEALLEQYFAEGRVSLEELEELHRLDQRLDLLFAGERSKRMRHSFHELLEVEKIRLAEAGGISLAAWLSRWWQPVLACGLFFLLVGAGLGYWLRGAGPATGAEASQLAALSNELRDMREMMMLTLLDKESTSDRLRAVNLTQEMGEVSSQVAAALLRTLNEDPNTNVRLAAVDALAQYAHHPDVRRGLIDAIGRQRSPLVQMALAETMVALQEKASVQELQRLLEREETAPEVRERVTESLEVLM